MANNSSDMRPKSWDYHGMEIVQVCLHALILPMKTKIVRLGKYLIYG